MELDKFYSLRKDFIILGITGRAGAGCSEIAKLLSSENFLRNTKYAKPKELINPENKKFDICFSYLKSGNNFKKFETINYKNVLLLHLIYESSQELNSLEYIVNVITQYGDEYLEYINRFGMDSDSEFIDSITIFLNENLNPILEIFKDNDKNLKGWLIDQTNDDFINHFTGIFKAFSNNFFSILNKFDITKRTRFTHDIALNLREIGKTYQKSKPKNSNNLVNIYTVAESINRIIKLWRKRNNNEARIVIDALKNSLELLYFKEKYSGFYMIAVNKPEKERLKYIETTVTDRNGRGHEKHIQEIILLDDTEYLGNDVNDGYFAAPDIENCIQKSDFHIFHSKNSKIKSDENKLSNINYQLIKLLALIGQPGIITPTALERTMQVAFNAKYNSGCISRKVGAVITDKYYSIKSIGWNDVAQNQMPCNLRSAEDLISNYSSDIYSNYELYGGSFKTKEGETKKFVELLKIDVDKASLDKLNGRNCSFCFKSFQNTYEDEKNQVHTRSLHAEENAMLQISKNGGVGLKGSFLFTTASPCELCSKKAFQLGIKKIFFIDPYPGIARTHTLLNGIINDSNPELEMFRGAVGRAFHKLYEPFMSHKDELKILTNFKPTKI